MLSLLFICIELLPVLVKILLNFGPPSAYDRLAELRDRSDVAIEEVQQEARRTVEEANAELLVMAELERLERQKEAIQARQRAAEERRAAEARRAEARAAEARAAIPEPATSEENARRLLDTGPIFERALSLGARTLRTVTRRAERETVSA
jgi:pyruvate-formate lyase